MQGFHHKHMFLKDKKSSTLYLLVTRHDKEVNLNELGKALGLSSGRLRFGSEEVLWEKLGVKKGAVSVFALINDKPHEVRLLMDADILSTDSPDLLWFHPLDNAATTGLSLPALKTLLSKTGHTPTHIRFQPDKPPKLLS